MAGAAYRLQIGTVWSGVWLCWWGGIFGLGGERIVQLGCSRDAGREPETTRHGAEGGRDVGMRWHAFFVDAAKRSGGELYSGTACRLLRCKLLSVKLLSDADCCVSALYAAFCLSHHAFFCIRPRFKTERERWGRRKKRTTAAVIEKRGEGVSGEGWCQHPPWPSPSTGSRECLNTASPLPPSSHFLSILFPPSPLHNPWGMPARD